MRAAAKTDAELVRECLDGKPAAFEVLVRRWSASVLAVCHAQTACPDAAQDLAQETLLRGFRTLSTLSEPERFGAWMRGIARRVCWDWIEKRPRRPIAFSALAPDGDVEAMFADRGPAPDAQAARADEMRKLMHEVHQLPQECREVLLLYYYQDATYQDLARMLSVSSAAVNARLTRARKLLRERMAPFRGSKP
jgi:RNA polymerase sigma-70 factor (ECF subfamily)